MKHGHLPDFTEQGELVDIADDSGSDVQNETAFARYMSDAMFLIPTPQVLQKIITGLDDLYEHDLTGLDMQGDLYEYMLGKLATAGQNGQFRTPKHIRETDGGAVAAHTGRHHLRPGLWHGGLSGICFGVHPQPL